MGLLVDGIWHDQWDDTQSNDGKFIRNESQLRHWITTDGKAGPSGKAGFKAEKDRYHLYVSLACPWAHRTLIFRRLKKLESFVGVSVVDPEMLDQGWAFTGQFNSNLDELNNSQNLHQLYSLGDANYSGRVTVPVLWDKKTQSIVSNESSEIIRMFNCAFNALTGDEQDFYPVALRHEIDTMNEVIYHNINNGVYRAGFATKQDAYEQAFDQLFGQLDELEVRLSQQHYLLGDVVTEADWRLFTTLIRFDSVYYSHFKCNLKRLCDYPNLSAYVRALYQVPGVKETVNFTHIKRHYFYSHTHINPTQIIPKGPSINFDRPHNRG